MKTLKLETVEISPKKRKINDDWSFENPKYIDCFVDPSCSESGKLERKRIKLKFGFNAGECLYNFYKSKNAKTVTEKIKAIDSELGGTSSIHASNIFDSNPVKITKKMKLHYLEYEFLITNNQIETKFY